MRGGARSSRGHPRSRATRACCSRCWSRATLSVPTLLFMRAAPQSVWVRHWVAVDAGRLVDDVHVAARRSRRGAVPPVRLARVPRLLPRLARARDRDARGLRLSGAAHPVAARFVLHRLRRPGCASLEQGSWVVAEAAPAAARDPAEPADGDALRRGRGATAPDQRGHRALPSTRAPPSSRAAANSTGSSPKPRARFRSSSIWRMAASPTSGRRPRNCWAFPPRAGRSRDSSTCCCRASARITRAGNSTNRWPAHLETLCSVIDRRRPRGRAALDHELRAARRTCVSCAAS